MLEKRQFKLCDRLSLCASFVRCGSRVADIGTDHAQLPVRLVLDKISPFAIASDIAEGPCKAAREQVNKYGLSDVISVRQGNGLSSVLPNETDDIVIAGMGGDVMVSILSDCDWIKNNKYRLILQPMSRAEKVRLWLYSNGFSILNENAVFDCGHNYIVICSEYSGIINSTPSMLDLYAGKLIEIKSKAASDYILSQTKTLLSKAKGAAIEGNYEYAETLENAVRQLISAAGGIFDDDGK